jgi:outer membrane lipoprotein-sorting protein
MLAVCLLVASIQSSLAAITLDEIMEKHASAMGGAEKVLGVESSRSVAWIKTAGFEGQAKTYYKRPNKLRNEVDLPIARIVQAADGVAMWTVDLNGQTRRMTGEEAKELRTTVFLTSGEYLKPEHRGTAVTSAGEVEKDGRRLHSILVAPHDGLEMTLLIDAETFLVYQSTARVQMFNVTSTYSDYREVDGVKVAYHLVQQTGIPALDIEAFTVSNQFGVDLPDSIFEQPEVLRSNAHIRKGDSTSVAFSLRSFHIYVPVYVNGNGPFRFILDSGAGLTLIGADVADSLKLVRTGELPAVGMGGVEVGSFVTIDSISVGDAVLTGIVSGQLDFSELNKIALEAIDGILGYDLFARFVVGIDYDDTLLTLMSPGSTDLHAATDTLDLEIETNHPMVKGIINDSISGRFRIDTGSMNYLDLSSDITRRYGLSDKSPSKLQGMRISGIGGSAVESTLGRLESFTLGRKKVTNLPCGFTDSDSGILSIESVDGNIGGGLLSKFDCWFDYSAGKLYLAAADRFEMPEEMISAGVLVKSEAGNIVVVSVARGSSAEEKGVLEGDLVSKVNGESVSGLELFEVNWLLNPKDESKVKLELMRGDRKVSVKLDLRPLF